MARRERLDTTAHARPKGIPGLESIRGLCPEEPSKQGSYYAAAVTHHAATTDCNTANSTQSMLSYMVALSSPYRKSAFPLAGQIVTMVPFAKSVGGSSINAAKATFNQQTPLSTFSLKKSRPPQAHFASILRMWSKALTMTWTQLSATTTG